MNSEKIAKYATTQSISEVGVGSILHAFHIPFSGQVLSLNQGFLMTLALRRSQATRQELSGIAFAAALLKSLSPAGKKLTPMLAIAMQGLLFTFGVVLLGANVFGALLGMILLSFWAYIQPLLIAWLFFGGAFFSSVQTLWVEIAQRLGIVADVGVWILIGAVAFKIVLGMILVLLTWRSSEAFETRYLQWIEKFKDRVPTIGTQKKHTVKEALGGAFIDLCNPLFITSLLLSVGFVAWNEPHASNVWIYLLRVIFVGYGFFFCMRYLPFERLIAKLK